MKLRVGVTGGIGSGKSTVCKIIETLGYPVYNADIEAKKITENDPLVISSIANIFGNDIYLSGKLDRKRLSLLVFSNSDLLKKLNTIVHPAVAKHFDNWAKSTNSPIVFKETAILFESGAYKQLDKSVIVVAPVETRIRRVVDRDGVTSDEVRMRMANQFPEDKLIELANYIIVNDGAKLILPQVLELIENLKKL